jgi:hypothetical protein
MRRQQAGQTLQHARVVLNDSYGAHTMLIHIDLRRMLREFPGSRGQFVGPNPSKNVVLHPIPVNHFYYDNGRLSTLAKGSLHGARPRRYAKSTTSHIFVPNN